MILIDLRRKFLDVRIWIFSMVMSEELIKPQMDTDDIDRLTQRILGCLYMDF